MLPLLLLLTFVGVDWVTVLKDAEKQVPRIEIGNDSGTGKCSGIVVEIGYVLTAAHCVTMKDEVTVNGRHGKVIITNHLLDLAVLKFNPKNELVLPLAPSNKTNAGQAIAILGFPFGSETFHVQQGIISAPYDRDCKCMKLNADVAPGDSGGAVVNDKGELVGMTTSIFYNGPAHLGGAVPLETIKDFLADFREVLAESRKK